MKKGQVFLSLVFIIGGIVILVGLLIVFFLNSSIDTSYGYQAATAADAAALSGAQDAFLQLQRNPAFATSYTVSVGSTTASVTVTQNSPATNNVTILSTATVAFRARKVQIVAAKDPSTGVVTVLSEQMIQ